MALKEIKKAYRNLTHGYHDRINSLLGEVEAILGVISSLNNDDVDPYGERIHNKTCIQKIRCSKRGF